MTVRVNEGGLQRNLAAFRRQFYGVVGSVAWSPHATTSCFGDSCGTTYRH